jgi:hypothetical protein
MLHVFWIAPSIDHAHRLLQGLDKCAKATHRDTPCVPTYFFRVSSNNADLCPGPPHLVKDHPKLRDAMKKLAVGIPVPAVRNELTKRGFDPSILDETSGSLDAPLPLNMQCQPVAVEFTEIYLDERAFMEHAGSSLHFSTPITIRLGTPPANLIEKILEPVLKEVLTAYLHIIIVFSLVIIIVLDRSSPLSCMQDLVASRDVSINLLVLPLSGRSYLYWRI